MFNAPDAILWILGQAVVAAAIWGGIRADIKGMHVAIKAAHDAAREAHQRLDRLYEAMTNHGDSRGDYRNHGNGN